MVCGKNKKAPKKSKGKVKVHAFEKKHWYKVSAPGLQQFTNKFICWTPVTKTLAMTREEDRLMHRVFETSMGDIGKGEDLGYMKMRFRVENVNVGQRVCLTQFNGMELTRDKLCSLVKRWVTLIDANVDIKTTDGYVLRVFVIGFAKKGERQLRKTSYTTSSQTRQIRAAMCAAVRSAAKGADLDKFVSVLTQSTISEDIMKRRARKIRPLENVHVRKVKVLKRPKIDQEKLCKLHSHIGNLGLGPIWKKVKGTAPTKVVASAEESEAVAADESVAAE